MSDNLSIPSPIGYRPPRRHSSQLTWETKRRLMIAGGVVAALAATAGIASWFSRSSGEIPVIQADGRPIRVKPDDPGGMKITGIENGMYGSAEGGNATRLAPAPETPNPLGLRAQPDPQTPEPGAKAPNAAPSGAPPAGAAAKPQSPPASSPAGSSPTGSSASMSPRAASPAAQPSATANGQAARAPTLDATKPAVPAPSARPAQEAKPGAGRFAVQLVAVQSEGAAQAEWQSLRQRHPDLFAGRQAAVSKIEREGRTLWRVRTGGFAELAEARAFCERVRAKGAACAVAEF